MNSIMSVKSGEPWAPKMSESSDGTGVNDHGLDSNDVHITTNEQT